MSQFFTSSLTTLVYHELCSLIIIERTSKAQTEKRAKHSRSAEQLRCHILVLFDISGVSVCARNWNFSRVRYRTSMKNSIQYMMRSASVATTVGNVATRQRTTLKRRCWNSSLWHSIWLNLGSSTLGSRKRRWRCQTTIVCSWWMNRSR